MSRSLHLDATRRSLVTPMLFSALDRGLQAHLVRISQLREFGDGDPFVRGFLLPRHEQRHRLLFPPEHLVADRPERPSVRLLEPRRLLGGRDELRQQPQPADAALSAQIARYAEQADKGASAFDAAYAKADRLVGAARTAGVSSDAWVSAQVAISALESARNDSVSVLL